MERLDANRRPAASFNHFNLVHFMLSGSVYRYSVQMIESWGFFSKRSTNSHIVVKFHFSDLEEAGDCSVLAFDCLGLSLRLLRLFPAATSSAELSSMVLNGELHWLKSESRP